MPTQANRCARCGAERLASPPGRLCARCLVLQEAAGAQQLQDSSTGERALEAAPEEYRNWEWHHLRGLLDGSSLVLRVPGMGPVSPRLLSPDARQVAVGITRGEVHLLDAADGRPGAVLRGHAGEVRSLAYSPDGARLASGGADGMARLWDALGGEPRAAVVAGASSAGSPTTPTARGWRRAAPARRSAWSTRTAGRRSPCSAATATTSTLSPGARTGRGWPPARAT